MKLVLQIAGLAVGVIVCCQGVLAQPTSAPPAAAEDVRRGAFSLSFKEPSPLSAADAQNQRYHVPVDPSQKYDLAEQTFQMYVPEDYAADGKGYGLLVWISAGDNGVPPRSWRALMDAHHLIAVGADGSGNEKILTVRLGLALDAVHNLKKMYHIDESRIYASGVSGGGKVAGMLATIYPEAFTGALSIVGITYFRKVPDSSKPGFAWEPSFARPGNLMLDRAKVRNRFVLMTGSNDFNRDAILDTYKEGFLKDGFKHVQYVEIPEQGHGMPADTKWIDDAIATLDAPLTAPAEPEAQVPIPAKLPATKPVEAAPAVAADPESAAQRLFSLAENYQNNGLYSKAIERLETIVKDYPSTKTAAKARPLLARLKTSPK